MTPQQEIAVLIALDLVLLTAMFLCGVIGADGAGAMRWVLG